MFFFDFFCHFASDQRAGCLSTAFKSDTTRFIQETYSLCSGRIPTRYLSSGPEFLLIFRNTNGEERVKATNQTEHFAMRLAESW